MNPAPPLIARVRARGCERGTGGSHHGEGRDFYTKSPTASPHGIHPQMAILNAGNFPDGDYICQGLGGVGGCLCLSITTRKALDSERLVGHTSMCGLSCEYAIMASYLEISCIIKRSSSLKKRK